MNHPRHLLGVVCDILLDVQSLARQIRASFRQSKYCLLAVIVIGVCADNLQCLIMHTHHEDTTLHVGDSRHVGNHIIFLVPTKRVFQILKFLPLTSSSIFSDVNDNNNVFVFNSEYRNHMILQ